MAQDAETIDGFVTVLGRRIHFLAAGEGPPLILLHSNGGSAYEFEDTLPLLARQFKTIAWDMPGQGDLDPLDRHLTVDQYADCVLGLLDALALERATVLGSSIGGAICVSLAARFPERFENIIIVECPFRTSAEWKSMWLTTEANYSQPTQTREKVALRVREATDHLMTRWNIDRNKAGCKTMLSVMWALREFAIEDSLQRMRTTALLIFGAKSPTIAKLERFRAALRQMKVIVLPEAGHFPMLDDPSAFVKAIVEMTSVVNDTAGANK